MRLAALPERSSRSPQPGPQTTAPPSARRPTRALAPPALTSITTTTTACRNTSSTSTSALAHRGRSVVAGASPSSPAPSLTGGAAPSAAGALATGTTAATPSGSPAAPASQPVRDDFATDSRPIILFDGVCNLCNGGVNFMLDNDPRGVFRLAALQSPAGRRLLARCGRSPDDISSIVLVERDRHFIRSEAILRIGAALRVPLPVLAAFGFPVPLPLRDAFYDAVANNRYSFFGRTQSCRLGETGKFADRFLAE